MTERAAAAGAIVEAKRADAGGFYTLRRIGHDEARDVARRLINSHFHHEPHARISVPARPDYDDDLLIVAYILQQQETQRELVEAVRMIATAELYDPATLIIDADVFDAVQEAARAALAKVSP